MQIGIIGAGKVGCSVGKYLQENDALRKAGYHITGYAGRRKESVEEAATFTGTTPFYLLSELVKKNEYSLCCHAGFTDKDGVGRVV